MISWLIRHNEPRVYEVTQDKIELDADELHPTDTPDLLTRNLGTLERGLQSLHDAEDRLTDEIDALSEQLRQTKVAIDAYTLAQAKLMEGQREQVSG